MAISLLGLKLKFLIKFIKDYEPEIGKIIKKFMTTYTFTSKKELKEAVDMWCKEKTQDEAEEKYGHISYWNISRITKTSYLFRNKYNFNDDISRWNVSNVINMRGMFARAISFNQPLNSWNVSKVKDMGYMFYEAWKFNQPLKKWNVLNVIDMNHMFNNAKSFNQRINKWNITNVNENHNMFLGAEKMNILNKPKPKEFQNCKEIQVAIKLWNENKNECKIIYGDIKSWKLPYKNIS